MPKEINDNNGTTWTLAEAYAGLKQEGEEKTDAARVEGAPDLVHVVATPSGGAQTVRLQLKSDWEENSSDEELLAEIEANREK